MGFRRSADRLSALIVSVSSWRIYLLGAAECWRITGPPALALLLAAFAFGGAIVGWILVQLLREHVDSASFARFTSTILPNETVVLAEVEASESSRVLAILRDVEAEAPVTFGFYPPPPFAVESTARPLSHELPSSQRLVEKAASLAQRNRGQPRSEAARAIFSAPVTRNRERAGMGEHESHHVG